MRAAGGPRVLVLNGSPRRNGNTGALARLLLDRLPGAHEELSAYDLAVAPCAACGGCSGGAPCVIRDAMGTVWEKLARAECVVIASPLHFSSLTAPMVALISRWQCAWEARRAGSAPCGEGKLGLVVATGGGAYPDMFECARRVAFAGFVTLGIEACGMLAASGMDGKAGFSGATLREADQLAERVLARWRETGAARARDLF